MISKLGKKVPVHVQRAPEPGEIVWKNMSLSYFQRFYRIAISYLVVGAAVVVAAIGILYLEDWAREGRECDDSTDECPSFICGDGWWMTFKSAIVAAVVSGVNAALKQVCEKANPFERQKTRTDHEVSMLYMSVELSDTRAAALDIARY